jgi:hypothetical protein
LFILVNCTAVVALYCIKRVRYCGFFRAGLAHRRNGKNIFTMVISRYFVDGT